MNKNKLPQILSVLFYTGIAMFFASTLQAQKETIIGNVYIVDGTGKAAKKGAITIKGDKIMAIGGNKISLQGQTYIDGKGLYLAPGFIDAHSHHLGDLQKNSAGLSTSNQGITTIVIGQDGEGYFMDTLEAQMKRIPVAANVASYAGHSSLREQVMGENNLFRNATDAELQKMTVLLNRELANGALGLSTGLEYEQAFYSNREEVLTLAKLTASKGGRYISHIRSEDYKIDDAIDEIIQIGKITKMPVQISHIKIANKGFWGNAPKVLARLDSARKAGINITADVYPYTFWNSTIRVLFPKRDYDNLKSAEEAVNELFDPNESYIVRYAPHPSYVGKTVTAIAKERNESNAQALMSLVALAAEFKKQNPNYSEVIEAIAAKSMSDQDLRAFIQWPYSVICSDGNAGGHPRGYGSFTRVLGKYVREDKSLNLENAIHKMTLQTAEYLGIKDRGVIEVGKKADLVLFNPATVVDHAKIGDSKALSTGIEMVWVNGALVYNNKKATGKLPGELIKRK